MPQSRRGLELRVRRRTIGAQSGLILNERNDSRCSCRVTLAFFISKEWVGSSRQMSFQDFCQRVAEREQVDPQLASVHTRSVVETLEDALSAEEIRDLRSQLPEEYGSLFSAASEDRSRPEPNAHRITSANPLPRDP